MCIFLCLFSGYCFLLFQDEMSVQALIEACIVDDDKLYWCVSSPTMKDKPVSSKYVLFKINILLRAGGRHGQVNKGMARNELLSYYVV